MSLKKLRKEWNEFWNLYSFRDNRTGLSKRQKERIWQFIVKAYKFGLKEGKKEGGNELLEKLKEKGIIFDYN